jgi:hypothetical protein
MAVLVMQKTEHDRINAMDPIWLQWSRRLSFVVVSLVLCHSILLNLRGDWAVTFPVFMLVFCGGMNLVINAVALFLRRPVDRVRRWRLPHRSHNRIVP